MKGILSHKSVGGVLALVLIAAFAMPEIGRAAQQAAAAPTQPPMTEKQVIDLIKHNKKDLASVASALQANGVAFEVTPQIEKRLQKAGATDEVLADVQKATPSARAAAAKARGIAAETAAERDAYIAVVREHNPAQQVKLAESFAAKYPKSQWLGFVYGLQANAYQEEGDIPRSVVYAKKCLALLPDNLIGLTIAATNLPEPEMVNNLTDAQKTANLNEAEQDANRLLQVITNVPKQPNQTEQAYEARKKEAESYAYSALGMVHLQRAEMGITPDKAELAKAELAYTTAVKYAPEPYAPDYYRLGQILEDEGKNTDAVAAFTKAASSAAQWPQLQKMAQQELQKLQQSKAGAAPATKQ